MSNKVVSVLAVSYTIVFTIECYTVVIYSVANKCSPKEFEKLSVVSLYAYNMYVALTLLTLSCLVIGLHLDFIFFPFLR